MNRVSAQLKDPAHQDLDDALSVLHLSSFVSLTSGSGQSAPARSFAAEQASAKSEEPFSPPRFVTPVGSG